MARPALSRLAPKPAGRAQMADVARLAGVSMSTVSRALRRAESVSPALRARVQQAVSTLGYVPNSMAGGSRSTRRRATGSAASA